MDFALNEEQKIISETLGKFAREELFPLGKEIDEKGEVTSKVLSLLSGLNLFGILAPVEMGGAGLDLLSYLLILEEIGSASGTLGLILAAHNSLVLYPLVKKAKDCLKPAICSLAKGEVLGAFAHLEAFSDLFSLPCRTRAEVSFEGFELEGEKTLVFAHPLTGYYLVSALLKEEPALFLLKSDSPGLISGEPIAAIGARGSGLRDLQFKNCKTPHLLAKGKEAQDLIQKAVLHYWLGLSALSAGMIKFVFSSARSYAGERKQFGEQIINFPLVQDHLNQMRENLEISRLLYYRAAAQELETQDWQAGVAFARRFSAKAAMLSAISAIQVYGGYGYSKEYPVERFFRDAQMVQSMGGSAELPGKILSEQLTGGKL